MSSKRHFSFTTTSIPKKAIPPEPDSKAKDIIYWDDDRDSPRGFGLRVGKAQAGGRVTRTFVVQRDLPGGKTKRISLGRWLDDLSLEQARELADQARKAMKAGRDPQAKPAGGATLRDAFDRHILSLKARRKQPRSIADAEYDAKHYWGKYLDRPLHAFTRVELFDIHTRMSDKKVHGPAAANRACRLFRAAWRTMTRLHETLPASPTAGIIWNGDSEERKPIAWSVFPEFWATIEREVKNPVRAALVRTLILTGLRSEDCRSIMWSDITGLDTDEPTLFRPNPKGGPKAAFRVPISRAVADIFRRRRDENAVLFPNSAFVFPTVGRNGKVTHVHNAEEDALRGFGYFPHAARHTFASAAAESGVSVLAQKALLNHRSKDITEHYQKLSMDFLRGEAEKVSRFLLGKAQVKAEAA
jgi:integrase